MNIGRYTHTHAPRAEVDRSTLELHFGPREVVSIEIHRGSADKAFAAITLLASMATRFLAPGYRFALLGPQDVVVSLAASTPLPQADGHPGLEIM